MFTLRWLAAGKQTITDSISAQLLTNVYLRYYENIELVLGTPKVKAKNVAKKLRISNWYLVHLYGQAKSQRV